MNLIFQNWPSCSGQRSGKANDNEEEEVVEDLASDNEDEKSKETSSKKSQNSSSKGKDNDGQASASGEKPVSNKSEISSTSKKEESVFKLPDPDIELKKTRANQSDMLIDLNSPVAVNIAKTGVEWTMQDLMLILRFDRGQIIIWRETMTPSANPFQSPRSSRTEGIANCSIPVVTSNSRLYAMFFSLTAPRCPTNAFKYFDNGSTAANPAINLSPFTNRLNSSVSNS